jgi:PAS domain S-box-containing protein
MTTTRLKPSRSKATRPPLPLDDAFIDHAPIGMAILRLEEPGNPLSLRTLRLNPAAAAIGNVPAGAVGKQLREFPEFVRTDIPARLAEVVQRGTPMHLGDVPGVFDPSRYFAAHAFPIPPDSVGIVFEDVTERRYNERQLERAQQLARMGSWTWDVGTDRVTWSDELYRIYGLSPETFKATFAGFLDRLHPDDRALAEATVRDSLTHCRPFHYRERIIRPDGEVRVLDSHGDCITDAAGKPLQLVGLCRDITEDARAVRALEESEQRFRKIFEASPAAICVFDPASGRLRDANPRFVELVGYGSSAGLVGKRLDALGMWSERDEYLRLIENLREARALREITVTYRTFGGQVRRALVALELIEIDGQESALGLFWRA